MPKPIRFSSLKLFSINLNRKKLFVILLNKSELLNLLRAIVATQKSKIANIIFIDSLPLSVICKLTAIIFVVNFMCNKIK